VPKHSLRLNAIFTALENGTRLAGVLFYPEVSAYGKNREKLIDEVRRGVMRTREGVSRLELFRRHAAGEPKVRRVAIDLDSPSRSLLWTEPLSLTFHAVVWTHGKTAAIAYVPALGIEVVADRPEDLKHTLEEHIRFALMREKATASLKRLSRYGRIDSMRVEPVQMTVDDKTPKQISRQTGKEKEKSVLREVATNLGRMRHPPSFGMEETVLKLADWLAGDRPRSVLLVGPSGVGKTAAVCELVRQRGSLELGRTPFWTTSGARIVAGMTGFGMWHERCQELCKEAAKTKAVVHLGNLVELTEVGQYEGNEEGVGHFLRPYIDRGDLLAIAECTPEQLRSIERDMPNMLDAFARVEMDEPHDEAGLAILREAAEVKARRTRSRPSEKAVLTLDRLHRRFATYSAYPGRPLRFLYNLIKDAPEGATIDPDHVTAAFSRETGLPLVLLEEKEHLDLDRTRSWFTQRVIGQGHAVEVIVNLLATVKAGMSRPTKPVASLLFMGPTGVGKTEMAKSLAEFLYRDRHRLTRIDMSEYAEYASIDRLIGLTSRSEGLLTAKVREQPFGVVLLDEFEKAHPRFFDLLLQVLGEGRLTDSAGRLADFRNSVIIMTSNLGTESFARPTIGFGENAEPADHAEEHFVREVQQFVRPEMFNRIDRIVPFFPLERETLRDIARRELEILRTREGIQYRDLTIQFGDELADEVVRLGYDPRYGARPIKRAIDRHLLAPLSFELNDSAGDVPLEAALRPSGSGIRAEVRARAAADRDAAGASVPRRDDPHVKLADQATQLRRDAVQVDSSHAMLEVRNQVYRLKRLSEQLQRRHQRRKPGRPPPDAESLKRLHPLREIASRSTDTVDNATQLEEKLLLAFYAGERPELDTVREDLIALKDKLQQLMIDVFVISCEESDFLNLVVYGEDPDELFMLARAYHVLAADRRFRIQAYEIVPRAGPPEYTARRFALGDRDSDDEEKCKQANGTSLEARRIEEIDEYLLVPQEAPVGIALCLSGRLTQPMLGPEAGVHVFAERNLKRRCLVHVSDAVMRKYQPPTRIDRRGATKGHAVRRVYDRTKETIADLRTGSRRRWLGGEVADQLRSLSEEYFLARVKAWIEQ
jgi:ATP-dependent Clp protease ATP-binding subunit ClpA